MRVCEAVETRTTCRAFLDTPVPEATVRAILEGASRAPSGGNLQPWRVWALTGDDLIQIQTRVKTKIASGQIADGPTEYLIYPPALAEPYQARKFAVGEAMYAAMGVSHSDMAGQLAQFISNFEFFGAPVGLFFAIDRSMQPGQWADLGMFMQSVMLLARERGLHTASLESWALWHATVRDYLSLPQELMLFCGMALGWMDTDAPINHWRSERAPLSDFVVLRGF